MAQTMKQKVQKFIEKHKLLLPGAKIIVGVSGGTDSVGLLHVLNSLGYNCILAHCNFHLRTDESDRDEKFVKNLAIKYKLKYFVTDFMTVDYAKKHKLSVEMAARKLRYDWFYELLKKENAEAIAVAHHADDNIETFLMNIVRGTGIKGLTGIPIRNGFIIRPLLCCTRYEIENYLTENDLEHVEDSTNLTSDYTRNKFRNDILPLLEQINPSVRKTLYQTINRFEGINSIYQQSMQQIIEEIVLKTADGFKVDIDKLKKQINVSTVLFEFLFPLGFDASVIEQIENHLDSESGKTFFSESHVLVKDRKNLIINRIKPKNENIFLIDHEIEEIFEPLHLKITRFEKNPEFIVSKKNNCVQFDADIIEFPLTLRTWNKGDSFVPFGMQHRKKVSNFFIDQKLNLIEKNENWIMLSANNEILWIIGRRIDNRFRIENNSKRIIQFEIM